MSKERERPVGYVFRAAIYSFEYYVLHIRREPLHRTMPFFQIPLICPYSISPLASTFS